MSSIDEHERVGHKQKRACTDSKRLPAPPLDEENPPRDATRRLSARVRREARKDDRRALPDFAAARISGLRAVAWARSRTSGLFMRNRACVGTTVASRCGSWRWDLGSRRCDRYPEDSTDRAIHRASVYGPMARRRYRPSGRPRCHPGSPRRKEERLASPQGRDVGGSCANKAGFRGRCEGHRPARSSLADRYRKA